MIGLKKRTPRTWTRTLAAIGGLLIVAACADDPIGPNIDLDTQLVAAQAKGGKKGNGGTSTNDTTSADTTTADTTGTAGDQTTAGIGDSVAVWHWLQPIAEDVTVSRVCGPRGCNLISPDGAVQLSIPRKALSHQTTIQLTQKAGSVVAIELGPHGTKFNVPVHLYVNAKFTNAGTHPAFDGCGQVSGAAMASPWLGLYFEGDPNAGSMNVLEIFPAYQVSCYVGFNTDHFSGYAIAM